MNTQDIKTQAVKFTTARNNLLLLVAFTGINVILRATGSDFYFLFSAPIPILMWFFFYGFFHTLESAAMAALVPALGAVSVYVVLWALSKKYRVFILVALILFSIEAVVLLGIIVAANVEFGFNVIIEIAFVAWILYYLVVGTIAWAKLMNVKPEDIETAQAEVATETANAATATALSELSDSVNSEKPESDSCNSENTDSYDSGSTD